MQPSQMLLIAGTPRPATGGKTFTRNNPVTGALATTAAAADPADAQAAADAAAAAFPIWSATGPNERRAILLRAAAIIEDMRDDFIAAMAEETGATLAWAGFNVALGASTMREAAAQTTFMRGETIPSDKPGSFAMAVRQPAGVVLGIAPWNAPIILGVRAVATPLACGNTVVFKASEICPRVHGLVGEALVRAGVPAGAINVITNAPADAGTIVGALIDHPAVRRVNFTGSTHVGRIIAERCARNLKPAVLELGGKAPLVVLDDADLEGAVDAAIFGAFMNQGQICMSTERIVVTPGIAEAFVARFAERARALRAGDPRGSDAPLGAMIDTGAADKLRAMIADAVGHGAQRIAGDDGEGVLVPANVLDHVTPAMRLYAEESFGPVVTILRARDTDHAIALANDTEFGLSSALFTRDVSAAIRLAGQLKFGLCHVNGATVHDEAQMPFGGLRDSGYGQFGGLQGIAAFTDLRWVTIETGPAHYPL
jgi:benzaldehyde dehydrogenase (NAD)